MASERIEILITEKGSPVVKRNLAGIGKSARGAAGHVDFLKQVLGAVGAAQIIRGVRSLSDEFTIIGNRLGVVTQGMQEQVQVSRELLDISNRSRTGLAANAELFTRVGLATRDMGIAQSDVLGITESLNQAVILSGANAQEAEAGLIQLSQGLNSGLLQRDELKSVLEQLPVVADIIAEEMDATRGQLKTLGAEGKITSDIIVTAFQNAEEQLREDFAKTAPTFSQLGVTIRNSFLFAVGGLNEFLAKSEILRAAVKLIGENADFVGRVVLAGVFTVAIIAATVAMGGLSAVIAASPVGLLAVILSTVVVALVTFSDQINLASTGIVTLQDYFQAFFDIAQVGLMTLTSIIAELFGLVEFETTTTLSDIKGITFLLIEELATALDKFFGFFIGTLGGIAAAVAIAVDKSGISILNGILLIGIGVGSLIERQINGVLSIVEFALNDILTGIERFTPFLVKPIKLVATVVESVINTIIDGINELLNKIEPAVREMKELYNLFATITGTTKLDVTSNIPEIGNVDFGDIVDPNKGLGRVDFGTVQFAFIDALETSLSDGGKTILQAFYDGFAAADTPFKDFLTNLTERAKVISNERRAQEQADLDLSQLPGGGGAGDGSTDTAYRQYLEGLAEEQRLLGFINREREVQANFADAMEELAKDGAKLNAVQQSLLFVRFQLLQTLETEADILDEIREPMETYKANVTALTSLLDKGKISQDEFNDSFREFRIEMLEAESDFASGFERGFLKVYDDLDNLAAVSEQAVTNAFSNMEDALVSFATTGKLNFKDFADSIIQDLTRIAYRQLLLSVFTNFGFGGDSATSVNGNKAFGGFVQQGSSYLVGERGPEVFTPGVAGNITSNQDLSRSDQSTQNVYVNVAAPRGASPEELNRFGRTTEQAIRRANRSAR